MRIALATDWWPPRIGGVESQVADLASALAARGHDVHVLTTMREPVPLAGVSVERVDFPMIGNIAAPDLRRVADIAAHLARTAPDVVHAHGMFSSLAIGAIVAASRLGLPSVSTVHSMLRPWGVFLGGCAIFRLFSNRADVLTAVSAATAADVRRASGRQALQIPNGLHLSEWRVPRRRADGLRIVSVMRLVAKKSPLDVIGAFHEAVRRVPRADLSLTIAGGGPERARLEREARRHGLGEHVRFLGACTRAGIRNLLAGASIFVLPGRLEAFGLALLEARAAGVPVVAMNAGGVPDLVRHRCHGLLADTTRGFHAALAELVMDDDLRASCATNAPLGLEAFDWPEVVRQHEASYGAALQNRGRAH